MGRPPCCDKMNVKRGLWTAEEDAKILACLSKYGIGNWTLVPQKAGLNRCGKSCRLRWTNYLRPDLKHDGFTPQEEELIIKLHEAIGSRWSLIAKQLPGRTDNDVKNYWNTKLRKKLGKMGIDPVTHKPFSQILSDYGNIKALSSTATQIGSLHRNSNNTPMPISEPSNIVEGSMMEQLIQDNNFSTNNGSWGFQTQSFQVMNQEAMQQQYFNEVTSSSSSSSSSTVNQLSSPPQSFPCQPSSPFSWSEFLIGDPFLPTDIQPQERNFQEIVSSTNSSISMQNEIPQCKFASGNGNTFNGDGHEDCGAFASWSWYHWSCDE
ncbi:hypothetical protein L1049_003292 [Liquidambar formosana]|uniref:Uncharacterized protein n=1 Tax=Liquidambar formosana TaxID=63359 RepID=A0AAP0NH75_LIQFO